VSIAAERRAEVEQDLVKLNARVARLWVETNAEGAELFVNGKLVGLLPLSQPVLINSGVCDIRLTKAGFEPRLHQVKVAGGEKPRVSLPLTAISSAALVETQRSPMTARTRTEAVSYTPFWVTFGVTAALGGASAGLGYWALQRRNDMDDELSKLPANRNLVDARANDVQRFSLWADVCGAAAVVAGGTALYFLISPSKSSTDEDAVVSSLELRTNGTSAVLSGMF
jgi:PEGA domain